MNHLMSALPSCRLPHPRFQTQPCRVNTGARLQRYSVAMQLNGQRSPTDAHGGPPKHQNRLRCWSLDVTCRRGVPGGAMAAAGGGPIAGKLPAGCSVPVPCNDAPHCLSVRQPGCISRHLVALHFQKTSCSGQAASIPAGCIGIGG